MNIPSLSKKVLIKTLDRWFESIGEAPRISNRDFEAVHQEEGLCIPLEKFIRLSGLYLVQNKYIAGSFSQGWSVQGFHVMATGATWAKESFFESNKEVCLVIVGAALSLLATVLMNLTMPNELTLSKESLYNIKQVITEGP